MYFACDREYSYWSISKFQTLWSMYSSVQGGEADRVKDQSRTYGISNNPALAITTNAVITSVGIGRTICRKRADLDSGAIPYQQPCLLVSTLVRIEVRTATTVGYQYHFPFSEDYKNGIIRL